jgi:glycosyltransferase involved in cell wall biosynthesis
VAAAGGANGRPPERIGLVIGQLTTGGAEGQLRLLSEGLDRSAFDPIVYCLSDQTEPYRELLRAAGVPVEVITGSRLARVAGLRRRLRADRIALVHAWLFIANAYAWAATRGTSAALVTSARNCKRSGRVLDALNRRAFRASDAIIVNSEQVRHYIQREYGAPGGHIAVVHNAIDLQRFRTVARSPGAGPCVVMVGRLVTQKNPLLFVAGAAALRRRIPSARFLLVGDGPMRGAIAAAVRAAGLEASCTLAGERTDVEVMLRDADLFWLTSSWEGLPNVIIEAMASGLPVVATDVGGTRELMSDGREGYVIAAGDAEALVARSVDILTDPALHARMRAAARARAETFGVAAMVAATGAVYDRTLRRRAA